MINQGQCEKESYMFEKFKKQDFEKMLNNLCNQYPELLVRWEIDSHFQLGVKRETYCKKPGDQKISGDRFSDYYKYILKTTIPGIYAQIYSSIRKDTEEFEKVSETHFKIVIMYIENIDSNTQKRRYIRHKMMHRTKNLEKNMAESIKELIAFSKKNACRVCGTFNAKVMNRGKSRIECARLNSFYEVNKCRNWKEDSIQLDPTELDKKNISTRKEK
jgi:hypothetical protein